MLVVAVNENLDLFGLLTVLGTKNNFSKKFSNDSNLRAIGTQITVKNVNCISKKILEVNVNHF